jgi:hypothetical protein
MTAHMREPISLGRTARAALRRPALRRPAPRIPCGSVRRRRWLPCIDGDAASTGSTGTHVCVVTHIAAAPVRSSAVSYVDGMRVPSMAGINAIADAAVHAPKLRMLSIAYNSIGSAGGKTIADAYAANPNLTELDIGGNLIGLKGGKAVADALETNASFTSVDVRFNSLDGGTKQRLLEAANARPGTRVEM